MKYIKIETALLKGLNQDDNFILLSRAKALILNNLDFGQSVIFTIFNSKTNCVEKVKYTHKEKLKKRFKDYFNIKLEVERGILGTKALNFAPNSLIKLDEKSLENTDSYWDISNKDLSDDNNDLKSIACKCESKKSNSNVYKVDLCSSDSNLEVNNATYCKVDDRCNNNKWNTFNLSLDLLEDSSVSLRPFVEDLADECSGFCTLHPAGIVTKIVSIVFKPIFFIDYAIEFIYNKIMTFFRFIGRKVFGLITWLPKYIYFAYNAKKGNIKLNHPGFAKFCKIVLFPLWGIAYLIGSLKCFIARIIKMLLLTIKHILMSLGMAMIDTPFVGRIVGYGLRQQLREYYNYSSNKNKDYVLTGNENLYTTALISLGLAKFGIIFFVVTQIIHYIWHYAILLIIGIVFIISFSLSLLLLYILGLLLLIIFVFLGLITFIPILGPIIFFIALLFIGIGGFFSLWLVLLPMEIGGVILLVLGLIAGII